MSTTKNRSIKEAELIYRLKQKDNSIFDVLYQQYWTQLLHFAGKYIGDQETCKEIVQELFITIHTKRTQLKINVSLSSYLYASVRNRILNHIRNESAYRKHMANASRIYLNPAGNNNIDQFMDLYDLEKEIFNCLNQMPVRYREVYVLNKQRAFSLRKTAEILQRPVDTVEKQLRKAMQKMQEHLLRYLSN